MLKQGIVFQAKNKGFPARTGIGCGRERGAARAAKIMAKTVKNDAAAF